jgi:hypothetical protein
MEHRRGSVGDGGLREVYLGLPPYFVLVGGLSILAATILLGVAVIQMKFAPEGESSHAG